MTRLAILLLPLLVACGPGEPAVAGSKGATAPRGVTGKAAPQWDAARCGKGDPPDASLAQHRVFEGQSPETLLAAYGKPSNDERFRVGVPGGVFYGALGKMPPGRAHPDAGKPARVLTWTKSGCELNVFFVQRTGGWAVVQAFEAAGGADY